MNNFHLKPKKSFKIHVCQKFIANMYMQFKIDITYIHRHVEKSTKKKFLSIGIPSVQLARYEQL